MPGDREDEICQKALQLLAELCSVGAVENENCRDFIYYLRDRARPRLTDSGNLKIYRSLSYNLHFGTREKEDYKDHSYDTTDLEL